jgi:transcriptional regulator with XRE-family HTH domain
MLLMRDKRQILADWVRTERMREDRNWSQTDLADRMGKVRAVVNKIESGSNDPTLDTLSSLAKAFGYPLTVVLDLLGYDVNMAKKDMWVEKMDHKMKLLPPSARKMAEKLLDALLAEEKPVTVDKKVKSKA